MGDRKKLQRVILLLIFPCATALLSADLAAQANDPSHQQFLFAYKLLQRGEDELAAEAFDEYLADFPSAERRGDATYYRAMLHRRADDSQAAIDLLEDAPAPTLVPAYAIDLLRGQAQADLKQHAAAAQSFERIDTDQLKPATAASVLYLRGRAHRGADNLAAAARDFEAAGKLDSPVRSRALIELSQVQSAMGRADAAVRTLRQVLALDDTTAPAEAARLAGDLSYETGGYEQAVEFYQLVISGYPTSPHFGPAVVGTLWAHYAAGKDARVLEAFKQHEAALPLQDRVQAIYLAGSAHLRRGNARAAADAFARITQGDEAYPLLDKALLKLAEAGLKLEDYAGVREAIGKLQRLYPQTPLRADAAYLLAAADARQGQVERGAARLTELIDAGSQNPYHAPALLHRARLYEANDKPRPAVADYQRFLTAAPDAPEAASAALRLIALLDQIGKPAEAVQVADALLSRPKLPASVQQEAMYRRAIALLRADKPDQAIKQLDELNQAHPLHPFRDAATYYRGLILVAQDKPAEAVEPLTEAGRTEALDPASRVNAWRVLAAAQRDRGNDQASARALGEIEALGGKEAMVGSELVWLGRYHIDRAQPDQAKPYLDAALARREQLKPALLAAALYETARMHRAAGRYDQALTVLEEVLAIGQGLDLDAQLEMARTLADMDRRDAAAELFQGLSIADDSRIAADALFEGAANQRSIAEARRKADDPAGAEAALREARKLLKRIVLLYAMPPLEPLPQQALLELADIAAALGQPPQRVAELEELIRKYPDGPYARYARALLAAERNRLGEATTLLKALRDEQLDQPLAGRVTATLRELEG
ncbi:MAG: tetratricopeptide repeat protein [Deinococcus-Thermus bacterium]|nr:tetratricopeptide repeat protein [Deinococcota bacterium]